MEWALYAIIRQALEQAGILEIEMPCSFKGHFSFWNAHITFAFSCDTRRVPIWYHGFKKKKLSFTWA
jgi:hypothetical protein